MLTNGVDRPPDMTSEAWHVHPPRVAFWSLALSPPANVFVALHNACTFSGLPERRRQLLKCSSARALHYLSTGAGRIRKRVFAAECL